jgi:hypothetical protein
MRSEKLVNKNFENDTFRILDIALKFLETYFEHSPERAELAMKRFFETFSDRFGEDIIHHESSYRMAAIIHYLCDLKGDPDRLGHWLLEQKFNQTPVEALDYFRRHYFEKYRNSSE